MSLYVAHARMVEINCRADPLVRGRPPGRSLHRAHLARTVRNVPGREADRPLTVGPRFVSPRAGRRFDVRMGYARRTGLPHTPSDPASRAITGAGVQPPRLSH